MVGPGFDPRTAEEVAGPLLKAGVPWIAIASPGDAGAWLEAGAWAVLPPGLSADAVAAYVESLVSRIGSAREESPLTGLPGNARIAAVLESAIRSGADSVAYADITDFKPFNDYYGFSRGDAVIRTLAESLMRACGELFVGHVGGDDFVCAGPRPQLERAMASACEAFRSRAPSFYSEPDRARGGIETLDRFGRFRFFPFVDVCTVILDPSAGMTPEDLAGAAGVAKREKRGDLAPRTLSELVGAGGGARGGGCGDAQQGDAGSVVPGWMGLFDSGTRDHSDAKAVLEAAGIAGDRRASGILENILASRLPDGIRKSAALSLGSLACPGSQAILVESLTDASPHVRTRAVEALALTGSVASAGYVAGRTGDPSTWVRRAALRAVGAVRAPGALEILVRRLSLTADGSRNDTAEREAALEGLALLADPGAMDLLSRMVGDGSSKRTAALWKAVAASGGDAGALVIAGEAGSDGRAAEALQWLNPSALSADVLDSVEDSALRLLGTGSAVPALRCLAALPGRGGRRLGAALERAAGAADGHVFGLIVTVMEKRGIPPGAGMLLAAVSPPENSGAERRSEDLAALARLAALSGARPGILLPLLRSRRREVAAAAARAVLMAARMRMAGLEAPPGGSPRGSGDAS